MEQNNLYLDNMKILLVDDTPANIDVLTKTLRPTGYKLAIAQTGEKAIKVAEHFLPDLILLDVMMPGMDGFETCSTLKGKEKLSDIPVIFITAKTEIADIIQGFNVGGVDYITKPFRQEEVHARVKTQLQLRASMQELICLNEDKNKFIGMAAHDLRNPLSGILGYCDMVKDEIKKQGNKDTPIYDYMQIISSASHEMLTLVDDLLDRSVIERGQLQLSYQTLELSHLVQSRIDLCQFKAKQKQITFKIDYMPMTEIGLDKNRVSQVIDNLLENAIKFSPLGATITVSVFQSGNMMQCSVQDEGQGISKEAQKSLFQAYTTTDNTPADGEKSTGLGLFIASKIIAKHGGQLDVKSDLGQGATFTFSIPIDPSRE